MPRHKLPIELDCNCPQCGEIYYDDGTTSPLTYLTCNTCNPPHEFQPRVINGTIEEYFTKMQNSPVYCRR